MPRMRDSFPPTPVPRPDPNLILNPNPKGLLTAHELN